MQIACFLLLRIQLLCSRNPSTLLPLGSPARRSPTFQLSTSPASQSPSARLLDLLVPSSPVEGPIQSLKARALRAPAPSKLLEAWDAQLLSLSAP
eukprot:CAMPEP_0184329464 /NCGR_PEP_ID=MMETSP1049-20130417/144165_1 /TAXON_ID=77928 /ORGANISM="Proteomonas sulcata, Strain CCMP704" /LENGTH=94 /DNA_ID=CAMNT_0026651835 /DNA_START=1049 /DNA_END=1333 /DNA_ORIENTATION=-